VRQYGVSVLLMSTQAPRTTLIRPPSLLDAELDLLEALRFAKGEPTLVIEATFEEDLHPAEASGADKKHVVAAAQRAAMMREIQALSKLAGAIPMARPAIALPALQAPTGAVTRESFITIPPAVGSLPPPAVAALPATPDASSPLDPTVRLPRVTPAFAAAITARSERSAMALIWAVLISTIAVAFGWWLVLGQAVTSQPGPVKTAATMAGASVAAPETSTLSANLASPGVLSTGATAPIAAESLAAGASSTPDVITGLVHASAIVRASHPAHRRKSKSTPKSAAKSGFMSAPETDSSMESIPAN
jgi:hypothetical protein